MRFSISFIAAALAASACASGSFGGSNLYFLQGLSDDNQNQYINALAGWGVKVIRIWVNGQKVGCAKGNYIAQGFPEFETTIRTYNYQTLAGIDVVLAKFVSHGIKAVISLHDGNLIHDSSTAGNGCDVYCSKYGKSFYTDNNAKAQIDARYAAILNYKSPSSGIQWGQWSEAILAFDVQNEPFQFTSDAANNDPSDWLCGRAGNMKKVMGNSAVKITTGGIGGDQSHGYSMMEKALECSAIDIMAVHAYIGQASSWAKLLSGWEQASASHNKLMFVEEWGVSTSYPSNFDSQAAAINKGGIPWLYWQMISGNDGSQSCASGCCTGYDGFEIGLNSPKGNLRQAVANANGQTAVQNWSIAD